jgi:UDP-N-acetylglucosamine 2-epimerase
LDRLGLTSKQYIVITIHRASNTNVQERFENIVQALITLGERGETIVFPIHPRTRKTLGSSRLYNKLISTLRIIEPLGYYDFLKLLDHSKKILTDSGGTQKEAYILKVPCVTLRENTEWVETISDGWNVLAGSNRNKIVDLAQNFNPSHTQSRVFGNGACKEIVRIIGSFPLTRE